MAINITVGMQGEKLDLRVSSPICWDTASKDGPQNDYSGVVHEGR
jgi:hypothetical protein